MQLTIDFSAESLFVYADHLLVVVIMVQHLRILGVNVKIDILGSSEYASRVNFFHLLEIPYDERFIRQLSRGRFIELLRFDADSMYQLQDDLTMIIHQIGNIAIEVKQLIFYCLIEIMDNVIVHSGKEYGWLAAQVFPNRREIRLVICDNGIGVLESLRSSEKEEFQAIDGAAALEKCLQRGVTDGKGIGFGLYATSEFIRHNKGDLLLYSGSYCLEFSESAVVIRDGANWPGTVVALRIRTDIPVDYKNIMPSHHTLPDDYQFFIDKFFGEDNELW